MAFIESIDGQPGIECSAADLRRIGGIRKARQIVADVRAKYPDAPSRFVYLSAVNALHAAGTRPIRRNRHAAAFARLYS